MLDVSSAPCVEHRKLLSTVAVSLSRVSQKKGANTGFQDIREREKPKTRNEVFYQKDRILASERAISGGPSAWNP